MKKNLPKYLLIILLLTTQWSRAQWYSYDAFEKKDLNQVQLTALAIEDANKAVKAGWMRALAGGLDFKGIVNASTANLKAKMKGYNAALPANIIAAKAQVQADSIAYTAAAAVAGVVPATLVPLQKTWDEDKAKLEYICSGKEKEEIKALQQEFQYLLIRSNSFILFPVRNSRAATAYFENSDTVITADESGVFKFEHAYLNYLSATKSLAAYTEPVSDFIGPVRLSLGLMVLAPSTKDSSEQTKDQYDKKRFKDKFKSGGGNATINASFPLLHINIGKYFDWKSYYSPRLSLDVPDSSGSSIKFPLHAQWLGWDNQVKITTLENKLSFLLCYRYARVSGNSTFYDRMNFTGEDQRKTFNFTTWTVGFIAKSKIAIYYTWYAGSSHVINNIGNNNSITANIQLD